MIFAGFKKQKQSGAIALILVIMITTLTVISSAIIAMINISEKIGNYYLGASEINVSDIDACIDDALERIFDNWFMTGGTYYINSGNTFCVSTISATSGGYKWATSTASTTAGLGFLQKTSVIKVNVSTSPFIIESYKDSLISYDSY